MSNHSGSDGGGHRRRRGWGLFRWRTRQRNEPREPIEVFEEDTNHNEINSNYLPSMEPPRLYPNLEEIAQTP